MKKEFILIVYSVIFAFFVWILDSLIDSLFFYEDSFLDLLLFDIPNPELFFRIEVIISFTIFGVIISHFFSKQKKTEKSLQKMNIELEKLVKERTSELAEQNKLLKNEIKKRLHADNQLTRNQKMMKLLFDGISDPIVLMDRDLRLITINKAAEKYYDIPESDVRVGSKCYEVFQNRNSLCQDCDINEAIAKGRHSKFERKGFMDPERIENIYLYPVKNETEGDWDMVLRIKDITEERLFEKKIIQNEKMIALGTMTSSIAHEIKNPIGFISFNVPILRDFITEMMPVMDEHARKQPEFEIFNMSYDEFHENIFNLLDNIEHGSARIETFVANLKDFTRLSYDVDQSWMDLNTVIESVVQMNREHILKKVKLFEKNVPDNLPKIWSDPNAIEQILLNLLDNAVQASKKENSKVALHVEVRGSWLNHVIMEVSDNGTGMDADTRNRIFDPFFTTKSQGKGMGLGLYVCRGLVTNLGGRIEVESQPGEGSKFRVILPDRDRRSNKRF